MSLSDTAMSHLLDDLGLLAKADPKGMMTLTLDFPAQCERAYQLATQFELPPLPRRPRLIAVCGMGGSAIGGDYLRALFEAMGDLPVLVVRDYHLPQCVDAQSLVFAVSYSGNTEETLACYREAHARGAMLMTLSSGGMLQQYARADGYPHLQVPGGQPPRTALGYLFIPLMRLCERWRLLPDMRQAYAQTQRRLVQTRERLAPALPSSQNSAKQMAQALHGRIPILYGSCGPRATVALRWKGQFNENAKQHAFAYTFPEMNHNEILGWVLAHQQATNWSVVVLSDPDDSPKIRTRIEVTRKLVGESGPWHELVAEGESLLERLMYLTYFGDFVSLYLAYLNAVDPEAIDYIDTLKAELAKIPD
ncbi:MAG: bifunctional phosphoglucose/phosphomannose isomerase [Armatimonadota bacterium]